MARYASLFLDVEDPFHDASDDAVLDCSRAIADCGVRVSFCVTGEKARRLLARSRADVIRALEPHALGLHTDRHSEHPTTMELLEDKGWDDGCAAVASSEAPGVRAFEDAFGRAPSFWGGAGNTWAPQVAGALLTIGIPACVYSPPSPRTGFPFLYCGCICAPGGCGVAEDEMASKSGADLALQRVLSTIATWPAPWIEVFLGHPTRYRHNDFWDRGYYGGKVPSEPDALPLRPDAEYRQCIDSLARIASAVSDHVNVLGFDDVLRLPWKFRPATPAETSETTRLWKEHFRSLAKWPVHRPNLSTDRIEAEALAKLHTLRIEFLD